VKSTTQPRRSGLTRRQAVRLATFGAASLLDIASPHQTMGQATPGSGSTDDRGYVRPESLIDVATLVDWRSDPALVPVGFMPTEEFDVAHIPGSGQIDWPELEVIDTSDTSIDRWHRAIGELIGDLGITPDSAVVVYDNGTLFSARLWWILSYLGHERVYVLDGGLPAWQASGHDVETGPPPPTGAAPYVGSPNPDVLAQRDEVLALLNDEDTAIVDARTPAEYADGHIPGAVNLNYPLNAAPEPPRYIKPASELRPMYNQVGVTPDRTVIPYCSSGVRSAVTAFTLHLLGFEDVALYTGSWLEWSNAPDTPRTTGDRP